MQLRPYQENTVNAVAQKLAQGVRKCIVQLATGGGKTIMFSAISHRYTSKSNQSVLILVDRIELLQQTRRTLFNAFGISAQVIIAGMKYIPPAKVYIGMIESTMRRLPRNVGLVIIDEAHTHTFNKIHTHLPDQFILGFTATPLSANKKQPLNKYYEDIVCGVDIPELINGGHLCQNITFAPRDTVDRSMLTVKNGEFDSGFMAAQFSKPRYVANTVNAYQKWANGTKAVIFNVSIEHSIQVNNAFVIAGYESKHLDSTMLSTERKNILQWFANTQGAILNNVGITTKGFDEPTIETVIFNKATLSMPLWLQCTGRGSRPTPTKSAFTIIDMGGNALTHGDWCDTRDWNDIFHNPKKAKNKEGVAPVKYCPQCDAIIAATVRTCSHCGHLFPKKEAALEEELADFIIITKGIDVKSIIEAHRSKKEYYPFFKIGKDVAIEAARHVLRMDDSTANFILEKYDSLAKEWCHAVGKKYNQWHKERAKEHLFNELAERFKEWENPCNLLAVR